MYNTIYLYVYSIICILMANDDVSVFEWSCRPAKCILIHFILIWVHLNTAGIFSFHCHPSQEKYLSLQTKGKLEIPCTQIKAICLLAHAVPARLSAWGMVDSHCLWLIRERLCCVYVSKDTCRSVAWTCRADVFVKKWMQHHLFICEWHACWGKKRKCVSMCSKAV